MMAGRRMENPQGFALLELLIVIGLVSLLGGALYSGLQQMLRSMTTESRKTELQQEIRSGVEMMTMDLRMAGLDPLETAFIQGGTRVAPILVAEAARIRFAQDHNMNGQIDAYDGAPLDAADFEMTEYVFDGATGTISQIVYRNTTDITNPLQPVDAVVLAEDLTNFQFIYLDGSGAVTADREAIRSVAITLTAETASGTPGETVNRTSQVRVRCRNL